MTATGVTKTGMTKTGTTKTGEAVYTVWDVESSGIDVFEDRIVQMFFATVDAQGNLIDTWEWFINPGIDIPEEAAAIHGFSNEYLVEHGGEPKEVLPEIRDVFLEHRHLTQIAFNMNYDLSILDAEMKRHGVSDTFGTWFATHGKLFDGLVADRHKDKFRKGKRNLETQAKHYGIEFDPASAHNALYDCLITAKVSVAIIKKYGLPSTRELASWQEEWRAGFEKYLRKENPDAIVERGWPLREFVPAATDKDH